MTQTKDKRIKGARTRQSKHLDQVKAQGYRCFLTGRELTPKNIYGILDDPMASKTPESIRWCDRDAGRLCDGLNIDAALAMMEEILRYRRPELFLKSDGESSPESA